MLQRRPDAVVTLLGSANYPNICGIVRFYHTNSGVLTATEVSGLPSKTIMCENEVLGFHIHTGKQCTGNVEDSFANVLGHFNPDGCTHPEHAGDMPPLFSNNGYAFSVFLTDRFSVNEIIGRTVIIYASPDNFSSQPSENSGNKIACENSKQINI